MLFCGAGLYQKASLRKRPRTRVFGTALPRHALDLTIAVQVRQHAVAVVLLRNNVVWAGNGLGNGMQGTQLPG